MLIAVITGLRAAEICGLRWDDINFDAREIYVTKQLQRIDDNLELVDLKTSKSKRKIPLMDITFTTLLELQSMYNKNMLENADYFHDYKFVVCNINGTPYSPDYISKNYNRTMKEYKNKYGKNLCEELNINYIRFHDLRHTHATSLLKQGTNPKIVAERLGHSSIAITLDTYSHVLPGMQKEAVDKLNSLYVTLHRKGSYKTVGAFIFWCGGEDSNSRPTGS